MADSERDTLIAKVDNSEDEGLLIPKGPLACDPRRWLHKYVVLFFMCFLSFGSYFCYDTPGALQDTIIRDLELSTSQYVLFYSLYSWPNVILCFFGGLLLDNVFGICWGTIIFSVIVTLGQVVFAAGALLNIFWVMCLGRFIFGLGGESLAVAQNSYAVNWFQGKALNMVFGLQLSFSRVGSTLAMVSMQPIYESVNKTIHGHTCLGIALMIGACVCVFSLFNAFMMGFFDKRAKRILKKSVDHSKDEGIHFGGVTQFNATFWVLCGICVAYYVAVFPFISLGLVFYENKYAMSHDEASLVNSLIYILAAVISPLTGFCIDRTGRNVAWIMIGVTFTLLCHGMLAFTFIPPYIPVVIIGFAYSILASALWPLVALIVPQHQIGTAYGVMQSIQNLGIAIAVYGAGKIVDAKGYLLLEVFFLLTLCGALLLAIALYVLDKAQGGKLNASSKERKQIIDVKDEPGEIN